MDLPPEEHGPSTPPEPPTQGSPLPQRAIPPAPDTGMAMLAHLLGLTGFIGPLIIYLIERDKDPFVRAHAAESLNFQITLIIASVAIVLCSFFLMIIAIGFLTIFLVYLVPIVDIVFLVIAAIAANDGKNYRYPFTIRFVS